MNNQQLKKGVLEILVLKLISNKDLYGYELLKRLNESSRGMFALKEGSLYPVMYRLEDKGYILPYRKETGEGRAVPRKYYKITPEGIKELDNMIESWKTFSATVNTLLRGDESE